MGMTMIEKILASHAGLKGVEVGDLVVCDVDMAVQLDIIFAMPEMDIIPERIADPERVAVVLDHMVPAPTVGDALAHIKAREFVRRFDIRRFFDVGGHGICHQVIMENGLALPGQILACSDSHTVASGALSCAATGLGPAEMLQVVCVGKTWSRVNPTVKFVIEGEKPPAVFGKDVFLHIAATAGSVEGSNVEFAGPGLARLPMDDRATIATMCAEISAEFATFPFDDVAGAFLSRVTTARVDPVSSDRDAKYAKEYLIDLSKLSPFVAKPDSVPHNALPIRELGEEVPIDQAFIGSCANGKLEDMRVAATVLSGRKVAPNVRLIVTPASQAVYLEAVRRGYVEAIVAAGGVVTNSTCGACYGGHMGVLGPNETCITSSTRNFKGRMGSPLARIYMASSATVAASAVAGRISDPTPFLGSAA